MPLTSGDRDETSFYTRLIIYYFYTGMACSRRIGESVYILFVVPSHELNSVSTLYLAMNKTSFHCISSSDIGHYMTEHFLASHASQSIFNVLRFATR